MFAASSIEKVSQIRHDLHAVQKGGFAVKEYVSRIKTLCALLEVSGSAVFEAEKVEVARDVPMVTHVVETPVAVAEYDSRVVRGERSSTGSRGGRGFHPRVQCQICNRLGHVAQCCYYQFDREFDTSSFSHDALAVGGEYRSRAFPPVQRVEGRQWKWQNHSATPAFGSA